MLEVKYLRVFIVLSVFCSQWTKAEPINFCRDPVNCFECDSRYDKNCDDPYNVTQGRTVKCNGKCIKVKHLYHPNGNRDLPGTYYTTRTCLSEEAKKNIEIRYTVDVCYTTMGLNDGNFCLCDGSFCNQAAPSSSFTRSLFMNCLYFFLIYLYLFLLLKL